MPPVLQDLAQSKKFIFVLLVTAAVLLAGYFGAMTKPEVLAVLGVLWPVYLGAQGVADVGAKIADGRVAQEAMASERVAGLVPLIQEFFPLVLEKMTPPSIGSFGGPISLSPLKAGDRFVLLKTGPLVEGKVLADYPALRGSDPSFLVRVLFDGREKEEEVDRFQISLTPPGMPKVPQPVPAAKA